MAKGVTAKTGSSKIRFIMLEAELSDGDLSEVTQAIQNALRPVGPVTRLIQTTRIPNGSSIDSEVIDGDADEETIIETADESKRRTNRTAKPRVARTPKILDDIDLKADPSLEAFVSGFDLSTDVDRYLVVMLWFRDARNIDSVTVDHVYTCFRSLSWSTASRDFSKPLRNLRDDQSLKGGAKDGFSLTLIGAGKIEKKKRS